MLRKQKGVTILEIIIVMGIIAFISTLVFQESGRRGELAKGEQLGKELFQMHNAVRKFTAINSSSVDVHTAGKVNKNGNSWLKSAVDCIGGTANSDYLTCDFEDFTSQGQFQYVSEIDPTNGADKLVIKTVIDTKGNGSNRVMAPDALGLAVMTAAGGGTSVLVNIGGEINSSIDPIFANTNSQILYCLEDINVSLLNENCTKAGSTTKEGGLIVMISTSTASNGHWITVNGSNAMHNTLNFDSPTASMREVVGVDRIYNLTGEVLKLGNSGIYYDNGDFLPILGDGLAVDTDMYVVGDVTTLGDIDAGGDIISKGNTYVEGSILSKGNIISEGTTEVWGDQFVLGRAQFANDVEIFGSLSASRVRSSSYIEAKDISAEGGVYAGQIINAPVIRASVNLATEGDLNVNGDSLVGGNSYTQGNSITQGSVFGESDLIVNNGNAFLGNVFASVIYDNDGPYLLDPSGTSRLNIMRANKLAPSTSGGKLSLNSNNFLFTSENTNCTSASASCSTSFEGHWDIEKLHVKNSSTGSWERLVDWLGRIQTLAEAP